MRVRNWITDSVHPSVVFLASMELTDRREKGFLVADTQLYKRLCPSVGPSVRTYKLKVVKMRIWICVWRAGEGCAGGIMARLRI